jgi:hypothetical protein
MSLQLIHLLQKGYFPIELPPPFNTTSFGLATTNRPTHVISLANTAPKSSPSCAHNLVRAGGLRRNLSIPNPKHFYKLAFHVVTYWNNIEVAANKSKYSLSKPIISQSDRAILPQFSLGEKPQKIALLRSKAKYILKADIARFFPSIYTHCIPWALLGKNNAKQMHANSTLRQTWQDKFDVYSRNIMNNQTVGIPIGTDISRIIAEIILGEIDSQLEKKFNKLKGIRFIDDYEFALESYAEAENVLSYLQSLLNEYELALNPTKTKIVQLPALIEPIWISRLRTYNFRDSNDVAQKSDLIAYFDLVFDFINKSPDEGIMKYSIARLRHEDIKKSNWELYESLLLNCSLNEPACLPQICEQLTYYQSKLYKINKTNWGEVLNKIIADKVPLGHSSEAAWAMWIIRILNIRLSSKCAKIISQSDDSIVTLMGIGLSILGLTEKKYFSQLRIYENKSYLYEPQWLLCYQLNYMNYFTVNARALNLSADRFYNYLEQNNVSFFDINTTVSIPVRKRGAVFPLYSSGGY